MDMVGSLPRTEAGNRLIMDYGTRWPEAFPLQQTDSRTITDLLMILFTRVGVPDEISTDCGANFVSRLMKEINRLMGVKV